MLCAPLAFAQTVVRGVVREDDGPRMGQPLGRASISYPQPPPNYFRLDGGMSWQSPHFKANLLVNNLLNYPLITMRWYCNGLYY